jgi:hydroxyacyl-ACP dehydratase HTD2-like protein with hotdog domain
MTSERQDLVYRNDPVPGAIPPSCPLAPDLGPPFTEISLRPDPVLLFRYSALTFNGHRIMTATMPPRSKDTTIWWCMARFRRP